MISDYFGPQQIAVVDQSHAFAENMLGKLVESIQAAIAREKRDGQDVTEAARIALTGAAFECFLEGAPMSNIALVLGLAAYRVATAPTSLADRMRAAADTLEEVSELYEAFSASDYLWSAARLRHEAEVVES